MFIEDGFGIDEIKNSIVHYSLQEFREARQNRNKSIFNKQTWVVIFEYRHYTLAIFILFGTIPDERDKFIAQARGSEILLNV